MRLDGELAAEPASDRIGRKRGDAGDDCGPPSGSVFMGSVILVVSLPLWEDCTAYVEEEAEEG